MRQTLPLALLAGALSLFAAGCGTTVGDPCTTPDDCGGQLCINREHTPGGYCSQQCTPGDDASCPSGTECIPDGVAKDLHGCYLRCGSDEECRPGYVCWFVKDRGNPVCIGPEGL